LLVSDTREPLSASQRDSVDHILRGGHHLLELINEVLDLARVESGRMEVLMAPIEVGGLVQHCLKSVGPLAARARVTLHPGAAPEPPLQVWADMTRLRQALLNLISNAIKYNRPDGEVFVDLVEEGDWVRIVVRDTGYGFDAEQARQLFQPFSRLEPQSRAEGTGIGLVLTRQLVELMGGRIEATGEPNVGATFTLFLKRAPD
jgi:signal transduction histidine kinase